MTAGAGTNLQRAIVARLRRRGLYAAKIHVSRFGQAGFPDIYAILPPHGRAVHLEVKRPGEPVSPVQQAQMKRMRAAGAVVAVVRSVEEAERTVLEALGE